MPGMLQRLPPRCQVRKHRGGPLLLEGNWKHHLVAVDQESEIDVEGIRHHLDVDVIDVLPATIEQVEALKGAEHFKVRPLCADRCLCQSAPRGHALKAPTAHARRDRSWSTYGLGLPADEDDHRAALQTLRDELRVAHLETSPLGEEHCNPDQELSMVFWQLRLVEVI